MSQRVVVNIDDFCDNQWSIMNQLSILKKRYPNFKVTLFTIPFKISTPHLIEAKNTKWVELAVHGFNHSPEEMLKLSREDILKGFSKIDFSIFVKGFRAPYWLLNKQVIECCNQFRMWVALHHTKNESFLQALCEYGFYLPIDRNGFECWYAHTYNIRDELPGLLGKWVPNQEFAFVSEGIERREQMVKLNFGAGLNPLKDFINLDVNPEYIAKSPSLDMRLWDFHDGLGTFDNESVDAATVSHALMYLKTEEYLKFFTEVYRVLKVGGIFRVTEDNCENPNCGNYGLPWHNPASITGPIMMRTELEKAGFTVYDVEREKTHWIDKSLIQMFHGHPPRVFHMEAIKPMEEKKSL